MGKKETEVVEKTEQEESEEQVESIKEFFGKPTEKQKIYCKIVSRTSGFVTFRLTRKTDRGVKTGMYNLLANAFDKMAKEEGWTIEA